MMSTNYKIESAVPSANLDVLATTATTSKHNAEGKRTPFLIDYSDASLEDIQRMVLENSRIAPSRQNIPNSKTHLPLDASVVDWRMLTRTVHKNYVDNSLGRVSFSPESLAFGNSRANPVIMDCPGDKTAMLPDRGGDSLVLASHAGDSLLMSNRGSVSSMSSGAEAVMRSIGAGVASLSVEESKSDHSVTTQPPKSKKQRKLSTSSVALAKRNDMRRVDMHKCLVVKGTFSKTRHTVHCQTMCKAKFAKMYSLYTCNCGKEYSKCPNTPEHKEALQWLTFTSASGHLGYRLTCYACKADNERAREKKMKRPWGTYEWTRCPVKSCKARYKYNSGSNSLRTIEKHNKKVFGTAKAATSTIDPADRNSFVRMLGNDFFFNCSEADVKKVLSQISRRGGSILQRFVKSQSAKTEVVAKDSVSV